MSNKELYTLWERLLKEQRASGKTIRAWCREQKVRENRFYYWRKKLQPAKTSNKQQVQWLPIETAETKPCTKVIVHLGEARIEIPRNFDRFQLREIIRVLQTV